ncbi:MAG: hybrid sensor histidine kinase/response regulator [Victivallales bacterium]|nr:hybrid sensor histidine kinase/response regulator [Victivallales bacterium]
MSGENLKDFSLLGLFLMEAENQARVLGDGLLELEKDPGGSQVLEGLMRAAHSLKGGARIVQCDPITKFAHAMEDYFSALIDAKITVGDGHIDQLLHGVDLIRLLAATPESEFASFIIAHTGELVHLTEVYRGLVDGRPVPAAPTPSPVSTAVSAPAVTPAVAGGDRKTATGTGAGTTTAGRGSGGGAVGENFVRVPEPRMKRLVELAGELFVNQNMLRKLGHDLSGLKKTLSRLDALRQILPVGSDGAEEMKLLHEELTHQLTGLTGDYSDNVRKIECFSEELYGEILACKIIPFRELARIFPRMVRDLGKELGKKVELEIVGEATGIDRDIMEKLEAPLTHLLRNAVDHGLETPDERRAAGKPEVGHLKLAAYHWGGMFNIAVTDDGRGIDMAALRKKIAAKKLASGKMLADMPDREVLDFLFLPGFTTRAEVSEVSGRGIGLDVVMNMVQEVRGRIDIDTQCGAHTSFRLRLPISLSVISAVLFTVGGDIYAIPATRIDRLLTPAVDRLLTLENHQYIRYDGNNIGVVPAEDVFGGTAAPPVDGQLRLLLVSDRDNQYALAVERFIGEQKIVVRPLDERLGKIACINAAAILDDGSPLLIVDADDLVRSIDKRVKENGLHHVCHGAAVTATESRKRILVIDDSLTVRELERQLLEARGFEVETAVNGVDGWNALRSAAFDMVITDVDMPRMNGFELVEKIKGSERWRQVPVMIVSYKDREEDKLRGAEVGADFYLTKSSFHDNTMIEAVYKLIGGAQSCG